MIKVIVNISKKVPGPVEYSSIQASCTIESEAVGDPVLEAAKLYQSAERAVDMQLHLTSNERPSSPPPRRFSAPITGSQLALLKRIVGSNESIRQQILTKYSVAAVSDLDIKQASEAIDSLKR